MLGYTNNTPYFGALCGRVANRIANGQFTLENKEYHTSINDPPNTLHGGFKNFSKVPTQMYIKNYYQVSRLFSTFIRPRGEFSVKKVGVAHDHPIFQGLKFGVLLIQGIFMYRIAIFQSSILSQPAVLPSEVTTAQNCERPSRQKPG